MEKVQNIPDSTLIGMKKADDKFDRKYRTNHAECCYLRTVLFAAGSAVNNNRFQPHKDDSQWWNRHDALVRCTAAYLFSTSAACDGSTSSSRLQQHKQLRELAILFDDDWSRIHMTFQKEHTNKNNNNSYSSPNNDQFVPTEECIISLWKKASLKPNHKIIEPKSGLTCQLVRLDDSMLLYDMMMMNGSDGRIDTPPLYGNSSKREMIELIQRTCSIDFLREHKLNSNIEVLLRKVNQKKVQCIWDEWLKYEQKMQPEHKSQKGKESQESSSELMSAIRCTNSIKESFTQKGNIQLDKLKSKTLTSINDQKEISDSIHNLGNVLEKLLQPPHIHTGTINQIITGTLHESCDNELPIFWMQGSTIQDNNEMDVNSTVNSTAIPSLPKTMVVLFMGAVRDMTSTEYRALDYVVERRQEQQKQQRILDVSMDISKRQIIERVIVHPNVMKLRIGRVAEFTSKILTVISFHHINDQLLPALQKLIFMKENQKQQQESNFNSSTIVGTKRSLDAEITLSSTLIPTHKRYKYDDRKVPAQEPIDDDYPQRCVDFVCFVDMVSTNVTTDLKHRNYILWCLVRVIVTSLWRSKVVSGSIVSNSVVSSSNGNVNSSSHNEESGGSYRTGKDTPGTNSRYSRSTSTKIQLYNRLTLIFTDGITLLLEQDEFLQYMSEHHQAAPTEYQVLKSIQEKLHTQQHKHQPLNSSYAHKGQQIPMKKTIYRIVKTLLDEGGDGYEMTSKLFPYPVYSIVHEEDYHVRSKQKDQRCAVDFCTFFYSHSITRNTVDTDKESKNSISMVPSVYTDKSQQSKQAIILLSIPPTGSIQNETNKEMFLQRIWKQRKDTSSSCSSTNADGTVYNRNLHTLLIDSAMFGIETPAVTVTMVQHCCYQDPNFLFPTVPAATTISTKNTNTNATNPFHSDVIGGGRKEEKKKKKKTTTRRTNEEKCR